MIIHSLSFVQIDLGYNFGCGIIDGYNPDMMTDVYCWGHVNEDIVAPHGGAYFKQISVGYDFGCGVRQKSFDFDWFFLLNWRNLICNKNC